MTEKPYLPTSYIKPIVMLMILRGIFTAVFSRCPIHFGVAMNQPRLLCTDSYWLVPAVYNLFKLLLLSFDENIKTTWRFTCN